MKRIAVYCGAASGNEKIYQDATLELADWLVSNNLELIYGGGRVGLMGMLATEVRSEGGYVHGIITQELFDRGTAFEDCELQIVSDMSVRKKRMLDLSDGCIALPGGPGTLEEIIEAFSWARLGDNENPSAFFNVNGYYDPLKNMFDQMTNKGFLSSEDREKLLFSDSLDQIHSFMESYVPPKIRTYTK
ncbi:LOG family protein [Companilactobacillus keshanensis]|uniref:Cytokinin riboside 5'-monophosphate phosphoribohydrolase n=1 Tax=Companilactobacillus keshanensis TaxID=2486003 RepID=A0ABW4BTQ3_9LACO|nr:TIGR00730 family Rossman fold protein [Companilactobacillus keshanensis]